LGFLDHLSNIITLLLSGSGVYMKDGQLVELDAVQEGWPETSTRALVGTSVNSDPRLLGVHFMDNLVPLGSRIADDEQTERLLGFGDRKDLLSLEDFLVLGKRLLSKFLCGFSLVFGELKVGLHFPSNLKNSIPGLFDFRRQSLLLDDL
jgi:hypothetical protein